MRRHVPLLLLVASLSRAESTKTVFSPFTGKLDYITALSTTSIKAGSGVTVSTTSAGVQIDATGSGAGTITGVTAGLGLTGGGTSGTVTLNLSTSSTNYIQNTSILQSGATFYVSSGTVSNNFYALGKMGIGITVVPNGLLSILTSSSTYAGGQLASGEVNAAHTFEWGLRSYGDPNGTDQRSAMQFRTIVGSGGSDSEIGFITNVYGVVRAERMTLNRYGFLGLGQNNTSPTYGIDAQFSDGVTPQKTMFIQDTTPGSGKTGVVIKAGQADADGADPDRLLEFQKYDGTPVIWARPDGTFVAKSLVSADPPIYTWIMWDSGSHPTIIPGMNLNNASFISWAGTSHSYDAKDVALYRNGPGVLEINDGTPGSLADLALRTLMGARLVIQAASTPGYEATFSTSASIYHVAISTNGHLLSQGGVPPTISACGALPNGSVAGNDISGVITVGGGVTTSCTLTFTKPYETNAPACFVNDATNILFTEATTSTSALTILATTTFAGDAISYFCVGRQ